MLAARFIRSGTSDCRSLFIANDRRKQIGARSFDSGLLPRSFSSPLLPTDPLSPLQDSRRPLALRSLLASVRSSLSWEERPFKYRPRLSGLFASRLLSCPLFPSINLILTRHIVIPS